MLKPLPNSTRLRTLSNSLPAPPAAEPVPKLEPITDARPRSVLDFDIENRPLSYWYDGKCTAEITAIAWSFVGSDNVECFTLTTDPRSAIDMLIAFLCAYRVADMVTGHYIRKHDLPIINGALIENGLPTLGPKLTSDTRLDLIRFGELAKSQAALGTMLGLESPKEAMSQSDWREANRLTEDGIAQTRRRVIGDVRQHVELRAALLERELLGAPRMWRAG